MERNKGGLGLWLVWLLALLIGAYLAYVVVISVNDDPEQIGYVIGYVGGAFLIAMAIRWLSLRLRPADRRPGFWSPWIIVLAGVIFLLARLGNLAAG